MNWLGSKTAQEQLQLKYLYIYSFPNKRKNFFSNFCWKFLSIWFFVLFLFCFDFFGFPEIQMGPGTSLSISDALP